MYYFTLEQAEGLKNAYSSWIGKKAYAGNGDVDTLKDIRISSKKFFKPFFKSSGTLYSIQFRFAGGKKFNAHDFFLFNGLMMTKLYSKR
ncbi:MAG: hypothetical protein K0Q95_401 [Bacteroidota bacterium]|jgi:hypothetical protein|nr:hypothetical protein [Bacteroidota bacterium]